MGLTRRTFLKTGVLGASAAALTQGCAEAEKAIEGLGPVKKLRAGVEAWVPSVCLQCTAGCGILVRTMEGRALKIEGNPEHPSNRGTICPKGQAGLQVLYDPDRIRYPLKRAGERGSGRWERIGWDDAIGMAVEQLRDIRRAREPHTLALIGGRFRGQMEPLFARFLTAFGSPNLISRDPIGAQAHYLTQGIKDLFAYDWENVHYVLSFGASLLEAAVPTAYLLRMYGYLRRGRPGYRAKFVQIDPRFSVTAAKADEWFPIRPGTDGALALGIAHVLLKEGLYDKRFVEENSFGLAEWRDREGVRHQGFRNLVLESYPPDVVAEATGISARDIVRLATEFGTRRPSIAVAFRGASVYSNGLYNRMAIHSLNALVGSIDVPGGVLVQRQPPLLPWPRLETDEVARAGLRMPRIDGAGSEQYPFASHVRATLAESFITGRPYPTRILWLYYTNPLFNASEPGRLRQAFQKVPFIVSFSPFMDESSEQADLILPDCTYLERWQDDVMDPGLGYPVVGLRRPVIEPRFETHNTGDVVLEMAKRLASPIAEAFPWQSFHEVIKERVRGLHASRGGSISADSFDEFWKVLLEKGCWYGPPYQYGRREKVFRTPSGKFEFYSQIMRRTLEGLATRRTRRDGTSPERAMEDLLQNLHTTARGDTVYLPHYEAPAFIGQKSEYPFHLNDYRLITHAEGRGANQPWLQEILGMHLQERWEPWLEINPDTAHHLGIMDGDLVWVESELGRIRVRARHYPGAMPNVVNMPYELGHRAYGRWAKNRGVNPNWIVKNNPHGLSEGENTLSTRVKVYKA